MVFFFFVCFRGIFLCKFYAAEITGKGGQIRPLRACAIAHATTPVIFGFPEEKIIWGGFVYHRVDYCSYMGKSITGHFSLFLILVVNQNWLVVLISYEVFLPIFFVMCDTFYLISFSILYFFKGVKIKVLYRLSDSWLKCGSEKDKRIFIINQERIQDNNLTTRCGKTMKNKLLACSLFKRIIRKDNKMEGQCCIKENLTKPICCAYKPSYLKKSVHQLTTIILHQFKILNSRMASHLGILGDLSGSVNFELNVIQFGNQTQKFTKNIRRTTHLYLTSCNGDENFYTFLYHHLLIKPDISLKPDQTIQSRTGSDKRSSHRTGSSGGAEKKVEEPIIFIPCSEFIMTKYKRVSKSLHYSILSPLISRNHGYPLGLPPNSHSLWYFVTTQSTTSFIKIIIAVDCAANKYIKYFKSYLYSERGDFCWISIIIQSQLYTIIL
ncbi:putative signal peptide protein [Puccinia sorghi]|uniref:Putative signal peptide protein n=1 Tax=Puccinia sorghi TaxID=27349 RepID=A0A0L6VBR4_9BASI|nr:putative signal peptide protein [Puccinia sorghi]